MPRRDSDRNLLFGILALQMDFITRDALIAAMHDWVLAKHRAIGEILVERKALDPADRALLEPMVARHVARHGGDPIASMNALSSTGGIAADLRRSVAAEANPDPDLAASLSHLSKGRGDDPYATRAHASPEPQPGRSRFRKVREHAEGGLGIVWVARDEELQRDVALKEIKEKNADHLQSRAKFLLEAEVTGGLEHPGIVPVYGLGHHDDGRPFYAMRFIRGRSLLEAIDRFHQDTELKNDPGSRLLAPQKLIRRFTDVCNAIDYAHSRGILHRDLKPANVMVGKYGETLVVDWGLAKATGRSGDSSATLEGQDDHLPEASLQPSTAEHLEATRAGTRVGTPAYMSPEQAAGRLDLLGPASDIYGLGATLYHLIVGRPPVEASSLGELYGKIQSGQMTRPRSLVPQLDPALEAICLKALALRPEARYTTPRALAEDLDRWIAGAPVAAYPEPWTRRARRWSKKHRTGLSIAGSALTVAALLLGGVAGLRIAQQRRTDASALATLGKAEGLAIEARTSGDLARWDRAIAEALLARERLESGGGSPEVRREVEHRLEAFGVEKAGREGILAVEGRDRQVVHDLEEARILGANVKGSEFDIQSKHRAYLVAFQAYGIDLETLPVAEAARRIRSSRIADDLISALDDWVFDGTTNIPIDRLGTIAQTAETDPRRDAIRVAYIRRDPAGLRRLCESPEDRRSLGKRCRLAFGTLLRLDPAGNFALLEAIRRENPADFWLNHDLGMAYKDAKPPRTPEALGCLMTAVALRPDSPATHSNLAIVLQLKGDRDAAIAEYQAALRMKPDYAGAHTNLGIILKDKGDLDGAIAAHEGAIRSDPAFAKAHTNLGIALQLKGQFDAAIAAHRKAIEIEPNYTGAHANLGNALMLKGDIDAAIAEQKTALRIEPEHFGARSSLGLLFESKGDLDAAIAEFRIAIGFNPEVRELHTGLGSLLRKKGDIDGAIAEHRIAVRIDPESAGSHSKLGNALGDKGDLDGSIAEQRIALRLKPDDALANSNLGVSLRAKKDLVGAVDAFQKALQIDPNLAETQCVLGRTLQSQGLFAEALTHLERGHELGSKRTDWRMSSAKWVAEARQFVELDGQLPAILRGEVSVKDANERLALANLCLQKKWYATSARFFDEAFVERPALVADPRARPRYNAACAASLAGSGQGRDEPMPDEAGRIKLRGQALEWLRADLAAWSKVLDGGNEPGRKLAVSKNLDHWKEDADLFGIRDEAALAKLPGMEREAFQALWAEVDQLLAKAKPTAP